MSSSASHSYKGLLLIVLVFGQLLIVDYQVQTGTEIRGFRDVTSALLLPLQKGMQVVEPVVGKLWGQYFWLVGEAKENHILNAEASRLRLENYWLRQRLLRFESESDLDAYRQDLPYKTIVSRVIANGPNASAVEVFIDSGKKEGLMPGMAVLTPLGIVGKIQDVYHNSSLVVLISDSDSGAGVFLSRTGVKGVLRGFNRYQCRLDYIPPTTNVITGELVFTSGLDGVYSFGLPVGKVTRVEQDDSSINIEVQPFAVLNSLEYVLVVIEGEHVVLPDNVRLQVAKNMQSQPWEKGEKAASQGMEADRIKRAYRRLDRKFGSLSPPGPPDI